MSSVDFGSDDSPDTTRHTSEEVSFGFSLDDTLKAMRELATTAEKVTDPEVKEPLVRAMNAAADCIEQFRVSRILANHPPFRVPN